MSLASGGPSAAAPTMRTGPSAGLPAPEFPESVPELLVLSTREYEIARHVAMGFSNKEVARMLEISHWTVAAHLKSTFLKLGVKRRTELAYVMRRVI